MQTIVVELINNRALRLLRELEDLHLIRLLKRNTETGKEALKEELTEQPITRKKASDFKGILSSELADQMQTHVKQSREEWQQRI